VGNSVTGMVYFTFGANLRRKRICLYGHFTGAKDAGLRGQSPFGAESLPDRALLFQPGGFSTGYSGKLAPNRKCTLTGTLLDAYHSQGYTRNVSEYETR